MTSYNEHCRLSSPPLPKPLIPSPVYECRMSFDRERERPFFTSIERSPDRREETRDDG